MRPFAAARAWESYSTFFYFLGMLFNVGLPSPPAAIRSKPTISRKTETPFITGFASVLQDRAVGLISLLIYGSGAVLLCPLTWRDPRSGSVRIGLDRNRTTLWLIWKEILSTSISPPDPGSVSERPGFAGKFSRFTDQCSWVCW